MKNLCFLGALMILCSLTINLQAQEDFKIKDASGKTLMKVREEGVLVTKLSTTERIAFASNLSTDDSGILVFDTDTQSFWVWKSTEWVEMDTTDLVDDADADPTNEIQDLSSVLSQNNSAGNNRITDLVDPTLAQDAATKAYVDALESRLSALETLLFSNPSVQERLDLGQSPLQILNSGIPIDSLYGKIYQGGYLFYIDVNDDIPGVEGYVAALIDQSAGAEWGCIGTEIGTAGTLGEGQANTNAIVSGCSESTIAAKLANDYTDGTYSDWFLPALEELFEMRDQLHRKGFGNFQETLYWSSTEGSVTTGTNATSARVALISIFSLVNKDYPKTDIYRVRAIRAF